MTPIDDIEMETMGKFSLELAAKTIGLWREEAKRLYPDQTNEDQQGLLAAALGTAGMLCVVDSISIVEPNDPSMRLIAFNEIIESGMGLLIAGATIAKLAEWEAARDLTKDAPKTEVSG